MGCNPWSRKESDTAEPLTLYFPLTAEETKKNISKIRAQVSIFM